jgi:hypothetical protein
MSANEFALRIAAMGPRRHASVAIRLLAVCPVSMFVSEPYKLIIRKLPAEFITPQKRGELFGHTFR